MKALATPTTQKIVKMDPAIPFNLISPKPKRSPNEVKLIQKLEITIPEHKIKVINLNQTGSSKTSSKKKQLQQLNP